MGTVVRFFDNSPKREETLIRHIENLTNRGARDKIKLKELCKTPGIFLSNLQGGDLRFWTFSKTNFGPFLTKDAKSWTFLYGVWFRGLEILQNIQNCGPFSTLRGSEVQVFLLNTKFWTFF